MSIVTAEPQVSHEKLAKFLQRWKPVDISKMKLEEYTQTGNKDTFTYWLELGSNEIGLMGGGTSSKFGIWNRSADGEGISPAFLYTDEYKWFAKYGKNPEDAFLSVRANIAAIVKHAQAGDFQLIDDIQIDSITKWKIAFIYSKYRLMPIYKISLVRDIAKHFEHPGYAKDKLSELHQYILEQKEPADDIFDFASRYFQIVTKPIDRNYYIIGSKYGDHNGNDTVDVFPDMIEKQAISTGFFWNTDFSGLVGKDHAAISKWITQHIDPGTDKFDSSLRTFKYFLNLKKGDLVAVKSKGRFGELTIVGYAEVVERNGSVYQFGDDELGHLVHVDFLEVHTSISTGLTYSQTIHRIVPGEKPGHFEKIFGSYAISAATEEYPDEEYYNEGLEDEDGSGDDIRTKNNSPYMRSAPSSQIVNQVHNEIQNAFAKYLKVQFPNDTVRTERSRIDIWRRNEDSFVIYEVKPYNTAFECIRAALGQLTDYAFCKSSKLKTHLVVVGTASPNARELKYINFLGQNLGLHFSYECFNRNLNKSIIYANP
ncbi:hypothetical protein [Pedobacter agri]|uniref:hypothetical protein n=1 Tax=Pedobacter agri TaxID=454586 RepID=UPI00292D697C|nr:hypothetical protein [Pedobacter agri]